MEWLSSDLLNCVPISTHPLGVMGIRNTNVRHILILANIICILLVALVWWIDSPQSSFDDPTPSVRNDINSSSAIGGGTRRDAFVTLMTDPSYLPGAVILAHTLKNTNTSKILVCMVTPDVAESDRNTLRQHGWNQVIEVDPVSNMFPTQVGKFKGGKVMSKLAVFNLTEVADVIVFIDSDSMVRRNIDHLFDNCLNFCATSVPMREIPGLFYFYSGLMVLRPNKDLFKSILAFANTPEIPNPDKADMGLLNRFFYFECQNLINHHPIPTTSEGRIRPDLVPTFANMEGQQPYLPVHSTNSRCQGLPSTYQRFGRHPPHSRTNVVHFTGSFKPWACIRKTHPSATAKRCDSLTPYEKEFIQKLRKLGNLDSIIAK